jgi:glyoxylase-like metal-dependent hydrolase (beta-lactamase superfamily II)
MGRERVICCWEVDGVLVDPGPQSTEATLLEALGGEPPRAILLTHIHLDHAGATGALVRRWPELPVHVHERGAPHLVDPAKLVASASQLYDDMEERWGEIVPVPEGNVRLVADGDEALGFRVAYTPGHASHHVSYLHEESGTAFTGDVLGVRIAPAPFTVMPTPPPDIDVELWHESLDTVAAWSPSAFALTHFGGHDDVEAMLADAHRELDAAARAAREASSPDDYLAWCDRRLAERVPDAEGREVHRRASPPELDFRGLERYWRKLGDERHPA